MILKSFYDYSIPKSSDAGRAVAAVASKRRAATKFIFENGSESTDAKLCLIYRTTFSKW